MSDVVVLQIKLQKIFQSCKYVCINQRNLIEGQYQNSALIQ